METRDLEKSGFAASRKAVGGVPNVSLLYEDTITRNWVLELWNRIGGMVGLPLDNIQPCSILDLASPLMFSRAVTEAIRADMILVGLRGAPELPVNLYVWVDAWMPRRQLKTGALVAIIGISETTAQQSSHAESYLRAVSRRASLDFMMQERKLPSCGPDIASHLLERSKEITPTLDQILGSGDVESHRHWGINE